MPSSKYTPNPDIPYGYCQCGCGKKTAISTETRRGRVKGEPSHFIRGHAQGNNATRFWERVDKSGGDDACWLWIGTIDEHGYGDVWWDKHRDRAHRIAYRLTYGNDLRGLQVLHNCPMGDNPQCCNPNHLWLGTNAENIADREAKGRGGDHSHENNGAHKITYEQVNAIRGLYPQRSYRELAKQFGLSKSQISRIVHKESWQ